MNSRIAKLSSGSMRVSRRLTSTILALVVIGLADPLSAQSSKQFIGRLGWVPINGVTRAGVSGRGSVTAVLMGSRVSIRGSFAGLAAPSTFAQLHQGVVKGARGPSIANLQTSIGTSGTIAATVDLTREQVDALKLGRLYIQVHSDRGVPPDGATLWGWLLPEAAPVQ